MKEGLSDTLFPNHKDKLDTLGSCKGGYQHMTFQLRGQLSLGTWLCLGTQFQFQKTQFQFCFPLILKLLAIDISSMILEWESL